MSMVGGLLVLDFLVLALWLILDPPMITQTVVSLDTLGFAHWVLGGNERESLDAEKTC